jgi:hypothetical protein
LKWFEPEICMDFSKGTENCIKNCERLTVFAGDYYSFAHAGMLKNLKELRINSDDFYEITDLKCISSVKILTCYMCFPKADELSELVNLEKLEIVYEGKYREIISLAKCSIVPKLHTLSLHGVLLKVKNRKVFPSLKNIVCDCDGELLDLSKQEDIFE